jgi:membrane-associated phospholipid phosphatase
VYRRSAAALATAYVALAALFALDVFRRPDQWAVDHLMPGANLSGSENGPLEALVPLLHVNWSNGWAIAANIVTLPAAFLIALVLTALVSRRLALVLLAAVAVEVLCKSLLNGPALYDGALHVKAFDSSFPSGHTLRIVILAGAYPRAITLAWAVAGIVLLELAGWHTPTDIAGGIVLGLLALLGARAAGALGARRLAARA